MSLILVLLLCIDFGPTRSVARVSMMLLNISVFDFDKKSMSHSNSGSVKQLREINL